MVSMVSKVVASKDPVVPMSYLLGSICVHHAPSAYTYMRLLLLATVFTSAKSPFLNLNTFASDSNRSTHVEKVTAQLCLTDDLSRLHPSCAAAKHISSFLFYACHHIPISHNFTVYPLRFYSRYPITCPSTLTVVPLLHGCVGDLHCLPLRIGIVLCLFDTRPCDIPATNLSVTAIKPKVLVRDLILTGLRNRICLYYSISLSLELMVHVSIKDFNMENGIGESCFNTICQRQTGSLNEILPSLQSESSLSAFIAINDLNLKILIAGISPNCICLLQYHCLNIALPLPEIKFSCKVMIPYLLLCMFLPACTKEEKLKTVNPTCSLSDVCSKTWYYFPVRYAWCTNKHSSHDCEHLNGYRILSLIYAKHLHVII
eukprot:TRINITY_DN9234_c0_g1_i1.p1 TRINITY_DN9234_c0_g1~~TRINITY_DN9234_c0_g1_i1.p1  ORF type:complete len:404 (+),score=-23.45 TRINITY_DN9234_c0_g1_i1:95-1213(+)